MAEQTISTTIADAPMAIPTEVANAQSATLANGVVVTAPVVACAYSWALLMFNGSSANAGAKITINYESVSITVTLGAQQQEAKTTTVDEEEESGRHGRNGSEGIDPGDFFPFPFDFGFAG